MKTITTQSIQVSLVTLLTVFGLGTVVYADGYSSSDGRCVDRDEAYKECAKVQAQASGFGGVNFSELDAICKAETLHHLSGRTASVIIACENGTLIALVNGEIPTQ